MKKLKEEVLYIMELYMEHRNISRISNFVCYSDLLNEKILLFWQHTQLHLLIPRQIFRFYRCFHSVYLNRILIKWIRVDFYVAIAVFIIIATFRIILNSFARFMPR